jgi:uncharacterized protein YndB with AHSA1/START domain
VQITVKEQVARPREEVFGLMADARNEPKWNSQVSSTELTSGEPVGQGTTFATVNRGQPYTATITEYDKPGRLVFDVVGKSMRIVGELHFGDTSDGTSVDATFDMQPRGMLKLFFPLIGPAVRKDFPKQFASFRQFCESSTETSSS